MPDISLAAMRQSFHLHNWPIVYFTSKERCTVHSTVTQDFPALLLWIEYVDIRWDLHRLRLAFLHLPFLNCILPGAGCVIRTSSKRSVLPKSTVFLNTVFTDSYLWHNSAITIVLVIIYEAQSGLYMSDILDLTQQKFSIYVCLL